MNNRSIIFFALGLFCVATSSAAELPPPRTDTPSGYPVPRFVSLKYNKTNCRAGPSKSHAVRFTFFRRGAPVLVVAETHDHWRKVRDRDGDECWAHKSVLKSPSHAFSTSELDLRTRPKAGANARGRIAADVLVKVEASKNGWNRVTAGAISGWVPSDGLWGLADSARDAAQRD